ncbi:MAG TPA: hypothetical protein VNK24_00970 [Elusimicrobiota bacterium]|nr:hypothetical protein [Elusimicrobiota bacterium]
MKRIGRNLEQRLRQSQRMAVFGRMRMAEWIEMPEREFAREIERLEKSPLFRKLYFSEASRGGVIRRQRWTRGRLAGAAEINERVMAGGGERVKVEERLAERSEIMRKIQAMGQEAFERYFLYAEEAQPLAEIARRTGILEEDARTINDFLLKVGAEAEFSVLPKAATGANYYCVARLSVDEGEPGFEFFSPHWARGLYQIRYDLLEEMKSGLAADELKKLPGLLKRLETINLRQSTMFRIFETLAKVQSGFLQNREDELKKPVSLRMLARRLDLAPSTICRALTGRSVRLPWGKEVPLIELLPGRRRQLRLILAHWLKEDASPSDASLAERLRTERGIAVSRRTVNAVRHEVAGGVAKSALPGLT